MASLTPLLDGDGFAARGGPEDQLLAWPRVKEITGLSRTTAWRMQKADDFPLPVQVSRGRVGWWRSDLDRWKASRASRPPSEARPFAHRKDGREEPVRETDAAQSEPPPRIKAERADPTESAVSGKSRRKAAPGQIAFDFGL